MRQERKQQKPRPTYKKSYERVLRIAEVFVNQNEGIKFVYYVCIGACVIKEFGDQMLSSILYDKNNYLYAILVK